MNKERFHNALALNLGYDRIVNNKGIAIKVDYTNPDDPWISLEFPEGIKEGFAVSEEPVKVISRFKQIKHLCADMLKRDIVDIVETAHQTYMNCLNDDFPTYLSLKHTAVRQLYKESL